MERQERFTIDQIAQSIVDQRDALQRRVERGFAAEPNQFGRKASLEETARLVALNFVSTFAREILAGRQRGAGVIHDLVIGPKES